MIGESPRYLALTMSSNITNEKAIGKITTIGSSRRRAITRTHHDRAERRGASNLSAPTSFGGGDEIHAQFKPSLVLGTLCDNKNKCHPNIIRTEALVSYDRRMVQTPQGLLIAPAAGETQRQTRDMIHSWSVRRVGIIQSA